MDKVLAVVQYILNMGPTVILPITILILGLIFKIKFSKALKSGLTIGIGFVGINLVVNLLTTTLGPAAQAMVERFGLSLTIIDVGWPMTASATWASPVAPLLIPICLIVNLILIYFNKTKTLNIDLWNYWHFIVAGATGYIVTGSYVWAIICAIIMECLVLYTADKTAPYVQEFYGLEGICLPTGSTTSFAPLGFLVGKVVEKIPGINKLNADPDSIQKRFGIFGEPMMMGIILGLILGTLAGYEVSEIFNVGMSMGAVMFLMPRMVKILMEGLVPISEAVRDFLQEKYEGRDLYIGLDAALATGHPSVLSTALILVPITLFLAVILPGNKVLPFGDLATIPFYVAFIVCFRKGNIVQSVITGTIVLAISLFMATNYAPVHTELLQQANMMPKGAAIVSSIDTGGNLFKWAILKLSQLVSGLGIF
ncbi:PTS galactitol transporter subunit IIC [Peptacetobacter hiranonis]|uniref:PTS system, galactitol-specific IIC component n=1 Tax=Peptacetobacter hiranonis (strain DSM 13275 / JCM 10541 / KCTC 15199 / TO-931) TaxID=500633 RepID=B6FWC7_PEPHT|nr:PTS galactitol transporter subunit IIC [Peptacetobacter hiranonis]EEA86166.1 PTS system, galactitol-specific IIC component [Peptacetobacter hiranonis DSM 13275]QEK21279.1 PTS system galactitol-specific EIIC component [Peptacetobacter hiranonis]